jgi:hypothetical protein
MKTKTYNGQHYKLVGAESYSRIVTLNVWRSECAECGRPFFARTPARARNFKPSRRCAEHRRPLRGAAMESRQ